MKNYYYDIMSEQFTINLEKTIFIVFIFFYLIFGRKCVNAQILFQDNFETKPNINWIINNTKDVQFGFSGDTIHKSVMRLVPNGDTFALIRNSEKWESISIQGEFYFPSAGHNYLGFIYNFRDNNIRTDFGLLYLKQNGSYIRASPWRDGNPSRLLYEEYKTILSGNDKITIRKWYPFKIEIVKNHCHLYIGEFIQPKITFDLFELSSGKLGFAPRTSGADVWIDNIVVRQISDFSYKGAKIPKIEYSKDSLITDWKVLGPFNKPQKKLEQNSIISTGYEEKPGSLHFWKRFETDYRGCVVTGKVTEYNHGRPVAYFGTIINSNSAKDIFLHFTTIDELTLFINGKFIGRVYRDGYISPNNDWNAWYDFWNNKKHSGRKIKIPLKKGQNKIIIRVRNGQFSSGGFFAKVIE